ncbi:MAG: GNAT family N-acetyltransferase [Ferruginibacter sp.]
MADIIIAKTREEYAAAAALFRQYADWLNIDLSFQQFDEEMKQLEVMYGLPTGAILLYMQENVFGACVAIRAMNREIAELKRMYVLPSLQGKGIGNILLEEAFAIALKLGYKTIRLDTLDTMTAAITLYKKNGFKEIPAYYFNPNVNTVYFEKSL